MAKISAPIPFIVIINDLIKAKTDKKIDSIIKKAWESDSQEFFLGLQYSMDPEIDYKIKKVPKWDSDEDDGVGDYTFNDFFNLTNLITKSKNISLEEISSAINSAAEKCNMREWNLFYRKIILKRFHTDLPIDVIIKSLTQLTSSAGFSSITSIKADKSSDASVVLSRKMPSK